MGLTILVLAGAALVGAALGVSWVGRRSARVEPYLVFRCPGCRQKVRYLASKAGRPGMCPRCRRRWVLPATPQETADEKFTAEGYPVRVGARLSRPAR